MFQWQATEDTAKRITRTIVAFCHPERVVLFGSLARGEIHAYSDLDLLVIWDADPAMDVRQRRIALRKAIGPTTIPLDILTMTPAECEKAVSDCRSFTSRILREGRVLYDRLH